MNRLQKKCVIATTGFHLLLLLILIVGPAFFWSRERPDDTQVLDMIPANLVDSVSAGVQNAQPTPVPKPVVTPPAPTPQPPAPQVTQPAPTPDKTEPPKPVKDRELPKPDLTPVEKTSADTAHTPKVNLNVVTRTAPRSPPATSKNSSDNSRVIKSVLRNLRKNLSPATEIAPVGNSSAAAANYAQVVKSVYEQAWTPPDDTSSDSANVKVRVTIARDGTVISAHVIEASGDRSVDRSVRDTLDRVQFIAPFPAGTDDTERTYIINFNLKAKRDLG